MADKDYIFKLFNIKNKIVILTGGLGKLGTEYSEALVKPGGKIAFDTSGHQMDFEDHRLNGTRFKDIHCLRHPFYLAFIENINDVLAKDGLSIHINWGKLGKYHNIFTPEWLIQAFLENGFEIQRYRGDQPFKVTVADLGKEKFISMMQNGERMRLMTLAEFRQLPEPQQYALINEALERTRNQYPEFLEQPSYEVIAEFVFIKGNTFGARESSNNS